MVRSPRVVRTTTVCWNGRSYVSPFRRRNSICTRTAASAPRSRGTSGGAQTRAVRSATPSPVTWKRCWPNVASAIIHSTTAPVTPHTHAGGIAMSVPRTATTATISGGADRRLTNTCSSSRRASSGYPPASRYGVPAGKAFARRGTRLIR